VSAVARHGKRRDDRHEACVEQRSNRAHVNGDNRADVAEIRSARARCTLGDEHFAILPAEAERRQSERERAAHDSLVDAPAEHGFGHLERWRTGDAQAVQARTLDAALG